MTTAYYQNMSLAFLADHADKHAARAALYAVGHHAQPPNVGGLNGTGKSMLVEIANRLEGLTEGCATERAALLQARKDLEYARTVWAPIVASWG